MPLGGVGNGKVASPGSDPNATGKEGTVVAKPQGRGGASFPVDHGHVASPQHGNVVGNGMKSGDKVASSPGNPRGGGTNALPSGVLRAKPEGGGTSTKQIGLIATPGGGKSASLLRPGKSIT